VLYWDQYIQRRIHKLYDLILPSSLAVVVVIFLSVRIFCV